MWPHQPVYRLSAQIQALSDRCYPVPQEALGLMQAYLPKDAAGSSGYTEGGALYALGLIHVNHGAAIIDYLVQQLKEANNEVS